MKNLTEYYPAILKWLLALLAAYLVLWGDSRWLKSETFAKTLDTELKPAITEIRATAIDTRNRVSNIENWQNKTEAAQMQDTAKREAFERSVSDLRVQMEVQRALLIEQGKTSDRILRLLESDHIIRHTSPQ